MVALSPTSNHQPRDVCPLLLGKWNRSIFSSPFSPTPTLPRPKPQDAAAASIRHSGKPSALLVFSFLRPSPSPPCVVRRGRAAARHGPARGPSRHNPCSWPPSTPDARRGSWRGTARGPARRGSSLTLDLVNLGAACACQLVRGSPVCAPRHSVALVRVRHTEPVRLPLDVVVYPCSCPWVALLSQRVPFVCIVRVIRTC